MVCRQCWFATSSSDAVDDSQDAFASCEAARHFVFVGEVHQGDPEQDKQDALAGRE